jgi:hypothetical protein
MALTKVIGAGVGSLTEDLALSDSDKIKLGAGSDLQLYHDGSHSYIDEVGTGSLYVRASIIRWTNADGSETLGGVDADGGWFLKANNSNALVIDTNGHVTKPLQSTFMAQAGNQSNIATTGNDVTVTFSNEVFDRNADYNNSNYTFTAPLEGLYHLSVQGYLLNVDTAASYYQIAIRTSNRSYYWLLDPNGFDADVSYVPFTVTSLVDMDGSDTATVAFNQNGGSAQTDIDTSSRFSGYLVA